MSVLIVMMSESSHTKSSSKPAASAFDALRRSSGAAAATAAALVSLDLRWKQQSAIARATKVASLRRTFGEWQTANDKVQAAAAQAAAAEALIYGAEAPPAAAAAPAAAEQAEEEEEEQQQPEEAEEEEYEGGGLLALLYEIHMDMERLLAPFKKPCFLSRTSAMGQIGTTIHDFATIERVNAYLTSPRMRYQHTPAIPLPEGAIDARSYLRLQQHYEEEVASCVRAYDEARARLLEPSASSAAELRLPLAEEQQQQPQCEESLKP